MSSVPAHDRYTSRNPCPICGGHGLLRRGQGVRCTGFYAADRKWAECSREEHAGTLPLHASGTYGHLLEGPCDCGRTHTERPVLSIVSTHTESTDAPAPIIATYDYTDEAGALLFQVVRRADKTFSQRRRDATKPDGWLWKLGDARRVLYQLPRLIAEPRRRVFVLEGEKDVDRALSLDILATCNPHGAGQWRPEYSETLRGRHVTVIADVDDDHTNPPHKGQKHAQAVVDALSGIAASVLYLELTEHDFSDWVDVGGSKEDLQALVEAKIRADLDNRPKFQAGQLKDLLTKKFPPPVWAVPDLIPQGVTLFAGNPKSGKSYLMLQICIAIALGGYVLGNIPVGKAEILYCDFENGEEILQERIIQALAGTAAPDGFHYVTQAPGLADGLLVLIETWKLAHPRTKLIVLDTFEAIRPPEANGKGSNAYRADYHALKPLADLAKRLRIAIVVVHHLSKSSGTTDDIFSHFNGSYGLNSAVDNLMALGKDSSGTVLSARGRRGRPVQKALQWDQQTAQWMSNGDAGEARQSETKKQILAVLEDAGSPLYPSEIATRTGLKGDVVRQRLYHMVKSGEVIQAGSKYQLNPFSRTARNAVTPPEENPVTAPETARNGHGPPDQDVTTLHDPSVMPPTRGDDTTITGVTAHSYDDPLLHASWSDEFYPEGF